MTPKIVYEDNHVLVAVKPFNVPSQADASKDADMLTLLKAYLKEEYDKPGNVYLGLVHRLDRPAGGLMVFARTSKAAARLASQLQSGAFDKEYLLRATHAPAPPSGEWVDFLLAGEDRLVRVVSAGTPGAKRAALRYRVERTEPDGTAVCRVQLLTGRKHQIRVQFASRGCPLVGDARYGSGGRQLALWSTALAFDHPTQKRRMEFSVQPPFGF